MFPAALIYSPLPAPAIQTREKARHPRSSVEMEREKLYLLFNKYLYCPGQAIGSLQESGTMPISAAIDKHRCKLIEDMKSKDPLITAFPASSDVDDPCSIFLEYLYSMMGILPAFTERVMQKMPWMLVTRSLQPKDFSGHQQARRYSLPWALRVMPARHTLRFCWLSKPDDKVRELWCRSLHHLKLLIALSSACNALNKEAGKNIISLIDEAEELEVGEVSKKILYVSVNYTTTQHHGSYYKLQYLYSPGEREAIPCTFLPSDKLSWIRSITLKDRPDYSHKHIGTDKQWHYPLALDPDRHDVEKIIKTLRKLMKKGGTRTRTPL